MYAATRAQGVFGRLSTMDSASHKNAVKTLFIQVLHIRGGVEDFSPRSYEPLLMGPPWYETVVGGLKVHMIPFWNRYHYDDQSITGSTAQWLCSKDVRPIVRAQFQHLIACLAIKRLSVYMKESESSEGATSKWIAPIAKQVEMTAYLFTTLLLHFTSNGLK